MRRTRLLVFCAALAAALLHGSLLAGDLRGDPVVLTAPGTESIRVETVQYSANLEADIFYPSDVSGTPPVVVFVMGFSDEEATSRFGARVKDFAQYDSWARLAAVSGLAGVTYSTSNPKRDLGKLVAFLRANGNKLSLDADRIGLWAASANAKIGLPFAMKPARGYLRFAVFYYGQLPKTETVRPDLPLQIVRASKDLTPDVLRSIDAFERRAERSGALLEIVNHPRGHAFDTSDATPETRAVVERTLSFMIKHSGS